MSDAICPDLGPRGVRCERWNQPAAHADGWHQNRRQLWASKSPLVDEFAGTWRCNICLGRHHEEEMFHRNRRSLTGECRPCRSERGRHWFQANRERAQAHANAWKRGNPERRRDADRKAKYGMAYGEYGRRLSAQGGGCAICGEAPPVGGSLHVDHCHATKRIRGLLCDRCNRGLGYFRDDPVRMRRAATYLEGGSLEPLPQIDVDLFAGPGGLDEGRRLARRDDVPLLAIEWEANAARTAHTAGHPRVRADVATFPTEHLRGRVRLLMGAPPCPTFSSAGNGAGRLALDLFVWGVAEMLAGRDVRTEVQERHERMLQDAAADGVKAYDRAAADARDAVLVLEPARWIHDTDPQAVVLEQVPAVLPIWQALARELRARGWSAWAGILNAADYGVPQTRRRAKFIASRLRAVAPPEPTHAECPAVDLFGDERLPWISMAAALGWTGDGTETPARTLAGDRGPRWLYPDRDGTHGAVLTGIVRTGNNSMVTGRTGSRAGDGDVQPYERPVNEPAPTLDTNVGAKWSVSEAGDPTAEAVRITVEEAATLQGFRDDYPWQGNRTRQFEQVGNAVPPPLAAHCITAALGAALDLTDAATGAAPARQEATA